MTLDRCRDVEEAQVCGIVIAFPLSFTLRITLRDVKIFTGGMWFSIVLESPKLT